MDELELYAKENNIPIMQKDGIEYLCNYIKENNYKNILEIGAAIGYSALMMSNVSDDILVTTIERDKDRYDLALENINKYNKTSKIKIVYGDALNIDVKGNSDLIFIDAAKSQSIKFFEKFKPLLNINGTIVTDNLNFHGLRIKKNELKNRNTRQMMNKIDNYIEFLNENKEYETKFLDVGDGISLTKK